RLESVVGTAESDLHRAFDDRDARSLHTGLHAKNGAGDGHTAVWRLHVEMAGGALGGMNHHRSTIEGNSHVFSASFHGEGAALVDFHDGTVRELHVGMRVG